ncbi:substrate-binding periplasmic protein [Chitinimonas sp.]|uniref:substrate-binding periplasmic protein n=1 Tax=Chitinimonas sp. TaxID=1934313 RepID=UPI002F927F67
MFKLGLANRKHAMLLPLLFSLTGAPAYAADLEAYTEEWPPYNYSQNGQVKGIATELLSAACEVARLDCEFNMVPWARAYATALAKPNTLVYTTARKPEREKDFLWVGPILPRTTWIFTRGNLAQKVADFKELAKHRVGAVRGEAAVRDLTAAGLPQTALVLDKSNAEVLKLLNGNMVDAMVDTEIGMAWNLRNARLPDSSVVKSLKLTDEGAYYFALNLKSDPAIVVRLQKALESLRSNGKIEALIRLYTQSPSANP